MVTRFFFGGFLLNTFDNFVHVVHVFSFPHALAPRMVVTALVVLV